MSSGLVGYLSNEDYLQQRTMSPSHWYLSWFIYSPHYMLIHVEWRFKPTDEGKLLSKPGWYEELALFELLVQRGFVLSRQGRERWDLLQARAVEDCLNLPLIRQYMMQRYGTDNVSWNP